MRPGFILINVSLIERSRSNPFVEPSSTEHWGYSFLPKGAFIGVRTHTQFKLNCGIRPKNIYGSKI